MPVRSARGVVGCVAAWLLGCQAAHHPDAGADDEAGTGGGAGTRDVALAGAGVSAGTGEGPEPGTGGVDELERDRDAIFELYATTCQSFIRCFAPLRASFASLGTPVSDVDLRPEQCRAMAETRFEEGAFAALAASVAEGRVTYRPELLDACIAQTAARACPDFSSPAQPPCSEAFAPTVAIGGRCTTELDCGADAFCDLGFTPAAMCPATCQPRLARGSACQHPVQCGAGTRCFDPDFVPGSALEMRCMPPAAQGEPCHGQHCAEGLICTRAVDVLTCEPFDVAQGEGAACTPSAQCAGGLACRGAASGSGTVCTAQSLGAACMLASECGVTEYCACTDTSCTARTCAPWPGDGEPCGTGATTNPVCAQGLFCLDGGCRPKLPLSSACANDFECVSGRCEGGECTPAEC